MAAMNNVVLLVFASLSLLEYSKNSRSSVTSPRDPRVPLYHHTSESSHDRELLYGRVFPKVVGSEIDGPSINDFHHLDDLRYKVFELARPLDV